MSIPLAEWRKTHCLVTMQTGPWEGPDSWCYRISCIACGCSELAHGRDSAWEIYRAHTPKIRAAVKAKKIPRGGSKKKVVGKKLPSGKHPALRGIKKVKVEWDKEFF